MHEAGKGSSQWQQPTEDDFAVVAGKVSLDARG